MQIQPLKGSFGADISGVDLKDPSTHQKVVDTFHLHGAIVVRDQELEPEHQLAFTRAFGTPELNQGSVFTYPGHDEILVISNKVVNGKVLGNLDAGIGWHTDSSYLEEPVMCTMLYAMEVPAEGSDTMLADLCAAYNDLPEDRRKELDPLVIHHSFRALREMQGADPATIKPLPDVMHPMIRKHPADGRKALWVSTGTVRGIVGMENPKGMNLIEELVAHATQDKYVYSHKWRVGDVLVWDNRCTLHTGTNFDRQKYIRHVHRTWVKGDRPFN
jgi:taurine dioxygenase